MNVRKEFLLDLPSDPDLALIELSERAIAWINAPESPTDGIDREYIATVLDRFITRFRPELLSNIDKESITIKDYSIIITKNMSFKNIDKILDEYDSNLNSENSFGTAKLSSDEKESLNSHLNNVSKIIDQSRISTRKKNALHRRIDLLRAEISKIGTSTDQFFALAGDVAFVAGEMAEKAKPFLKEVKEILKIVRGSRARNENIQLPETLDPLALPNPDTDTLDAQEEADAD